MVRAARPLQAAIALMKTWLPLAPARALGLARTVSMSRRLSIVLDGYPVRHEMAATDVWPERRFVRHVVIEELTVTPYRSTVPSK